MAGLLTYAELATALKLRDKADEFVGVAGEQGWTDGGIILALILLNLGGGNHVEDMSRLGQDPGFAEIMRHLMIVGLTHGQRRRYKRRFHKGGEHPVPSTSAVGRYLEGFADSQTEQKRVPGRAVVPTPSKGLVGLKRLNGKLAEAMARRCSISTATLDQDATLIATEKKDAKFCYKHFRAYQPMNVWWDELRMMLHTEFRDGNVPAAYQNLNVLRDALEMLPASVKQVRFRADTAGYDIALLRFLAEGRSKRFGVIEFAIGVDITKTFRRAARQVKESDWQTLLSSKSNGDEYDTGQQWAEVCFVPNNLATKKDGPAYRFIAIREPLRQLELPGLEQKDLPFPTAEFTGKRYKLFGMVTNRELPGGDLIRWHRQRCGRSEHVHAVLKSDLAGGCLPSGKFGANAAWWSIAVLAHNLDTALRQLVLGKNWLGRRMKAMRFLLINVAALVVWRSRRIFFRFTGGSSALDLIRSTRLHIANLATGPPG